MARFTNCSKCGKYKPHEGHGLCRNCYIKEWRQSKPDNKRKKVPRKIKDSIKHTSGYVRILSPNHPNKDSQNYVFEHRLVYEHYLKILFDEDVYIPDYMDVHHINGIKDDNRIQNLELISKVEHGILHHPKRNINYFCLVCGSKTTYIRKEDNSPAWHIYKNGYRCKKCYNKEYTSRLKKEGNRHSSQV